MGTKRRRHSPDQIIRKLAGYIAYARPADPVGKSVSRPGSRVSRSFALPFTRKSRATLA